MKKYVITYEDEFDVLHMNNGHGYVAIAFGNQNELAMYIKEKNIDMNEVI